MDPFQGVASFVLGWMKQTAMAKWLRLLFEMATGALVTLCFFTGTVTLSSGSLTVGFATGLVAVSLVLLAQFKMSPLTKGLTLAVPLRIADEALAQRVELVAGGGMPEKVSPSAIASNAVGPKLVEPVNQNLTAAQPDAPLDPASIFGK